jgi:hypothetical protein
MAKWWMKTWICNVDELHDWHAMSVHLPRICLVKRYAVIVHAADSVRSYIVLFGHSRYQHGVYPHTIILDRYLADMNIKKRSP